MKNKLTNITDNELMTRKEALIKASKYAVYTALGTFVLLNPKKAQAQSEPEGPGGGF